MGGKLFKEPNCFCLFFLEETNNFSFLSFFCNKETKDNKKFTETDNKSKWKTQHEYLIAAIRAARTGTPMTVKMPPELEGKETCKYCLRRFNSNAIERHEPICEKLTLKQQQRKTKNDQQQQQLLYL